MKACQSLRAHIFIIVIQAQAGQNFPLIVLRQLAIVLFCIFYSLLNQFQLFKVIPVFNKEKKIELQVG